jgi:hypothetical protein
MRTFFLKNWNRITAFFFTLLGASITLTAVCTIEDRVIYAILDMTCAVPMLAIWSYQSKILREIYAD